MVQEVEFAQLAGSLGCDWHWQQLSLLGDGQLQQLQPHSVSLCQQVHRQNPAHQCLQSNEQPLLACTDWTLGTLDTSASAQPAMAAKTGAMGVRLEALDAR